MEYTKLLGKVTLTCNGLHDISKNYDRLCLVYDNLYRSFISKKEVPVNVEVTNADFWQPLSVLSVNGDDLQLTNDLKISFADKTYNPAEYSGLGKVYLRKNVVNNKNILKQTHVNKPNTAYVIRYDYNLDGATLDIPENSVLIFDGGSLSNGTVNLNNTRILPQAFTVQDYLKCTINGTYKDGQLRYDSDEDKLIASISGNDVILGEEIVINTNPKYVWIAYANNPNGFGLSFTPELDTAYIGIAHNKDTKEQSNNPIEYVWSRIKGDRGEQGIPGPKGEQGIPGQPGPLGVPGQDGQDGVAITPNWNTFVFKQSETKPLKPGFTDPEPGEIGINGWFTKPSSIGKWWMSVGKVDGTTNQVTQWSDPAQCTAEDGLTNSYVDFKYAKSTDPFQSPALVRTDRRPAGWYDEVPETIDGEYLWMITALIDENDNLVDRWSAPARLTGSKGPKGELGTQGIAGTSQFFHIRYSLNPDGNPMLVDPSIYVGTAITQSSIAPIDYTQYTWSRFQGAQGLQGELGIPGANGENGKTSYLHIKYSNDGGITFTPQAGSLAPGETPGAYLGQYADFIEWDSNDVNDYKWVKIQGDTGPLGIPGTDGLNGITHYTWIAYADDQNGNGIANSPEGKLYIGFAYNKTSPDEVYDPNLYKWSLLSGEAGVPGLPGEDGTTYYTWIKYSDLKPSASHTTIYDIPTDNTKYIGIAVNKTTQIESTNWQDYSWSLFKGEDALNIRPNELIKSRKVDGTDLGDVVFVDYSDYTEYTATNVSSGSAFVALGDAHSNAWGDTVRTLMTTHTVVLSFDWQVSSGTLMLPKFENTQMSIYKGSLLIGKWVRIYIVNPDSNIEMNFSVPGNPSSIVNFTGKYKVRNFKLEIIQPNEPSIPTAYIPHIDEMFGGTGKVPYPAGMWKSNTLYKQTEDTVPYVLDPNDNSYYILLTSQVNSSVSPKNDTTNWKKMDKFEVVYTELLIANGGTLGNFVFKDNYMYVKQGVNKLGRSVTNFLNFNQEIPDPVNLHEDYWVLTNPTYMPGAEDGVSSNVPDSLNVLRVIIDDDCNVTNKPICVTKQREIPAHTVYIKNPPVDYRQAQTGILYVYIKFVYFYYTATGEYKSKDIPLTYNTFTDLPKSYLYTGADSKDVGYFVTVASNEWTQYLFMQISDENFIPNLLINTQTGELITNNIKIKNDISDEIYTLNVGESSSIIESMVGKFRLVQFNIKESLDHNANLVFLPESQQTLLGKTIKLLAKSTDVYSRDKTLRIVQNYFGDTNSSRGIYWRNKPILEVYIKNGDYIEFQCVLLENNKYAWLVLNADDYKFHQYGATQCLISKDEMYGGESIPNILISGKINKLGRLTSKFLYDVNILGNTTGLKNNVHVFRPSQGTYKIILDGPITNYNTFLLYNVHTIHEDDIVSMRKVNEIEYHINIFNFSNTDSGVTMTYIDCDIDFNIFRMPNSVYIKPE